MKEIRVKGINTTNMTIKNGDLVFGKVKNSKFQKLLIWLRLRKSPRLTIVGIVKGIDTSSFEDGERLYLDPNKPGSFLPGSEKYINPIIKRMV